MEERDGNVPQSKLILEAIKEAVKRGLPQCVELLIGYPQDDGSVLLPTDKQVNITHGPTLDLTGQPYARSQVGDDLPISQKNGSVAPAPSDPTANSVVKDSSWVHQPGESRPEQYREGPVSGTRQALGYAIRPPSLRNIKNDAYVDYLEAQAMKRMPTFWVVEGHSRMVKVWFASFKDFTDAQAAVKEFEEKQKARRDEPERSGVKRSEPKSLRKKQTRAGKKRRG